MTVMLFSQQMYISVNFVYTITFCPYLLPFIIKFWTRKFWRICFSTLVYHGSILCQHTFNLFIVRSLTFNWYWQDQAKLIRYIRTYTYICTCVFALCFVFYQFRGSNHTNHIWTISTRSLLRTVLRRGKVWHNGLNRFQSHL